MADGTRHAADESVLTSVGAKRSHWARLAYCCERGATGEGRGIQEVTGLAIAINASADGVNVAVIGSRVHSSIRAEHGGRSHVGTSFVPPLQTACVISATADCVDGVDVLVPRAQVKCSVRAKNWRRINAAKGGVQPLEAAGISACTTDGDKSNNVFVDGGHIQGSIRA